MYSKGYIKKNYYENRKLLPYNETRMPLVLFAVNKLYEDMKASNEKS